MVDTLSADALCEATTLLRHVPDSAVVIVRIARALAAKPHPDSIAMPRRTTCAFRQVMNGLQFRGRLREAERLTTLDAHTMRTSILYDMSRFGMVSRDSSRAAFHRVLALAPRTTVTRLYSWWASDGDTAAIQKYIREYEVIRSSQAPIQQMRRANAAAGRAYLALARRDTAAAVRLLISTPDTVYECWYESRITLVQLLRATGRYREAAERLERRWPGTTQCGSGVDDVVWTMERARVFDHLGRSDRAIESYAFVADAWRTADPELQPYVRESQAALARLRGARVVRLTYSKEDGRFSM